jgi:hypothetical protein
VLPFLVKGRAGGAPRQHAPATAPTARSPTGPRSRVPDRLPIQCTPDVHEQRPRELEVARRQRPQRHQPIGDACRGRSSRATWLPAAHAARHHGRRAAHRGPCRTPSQQNASTRTDAVALGLVVVAASTKRKSRSGRRAPRRRSAGPPSCRPPRGSRAVSGVRARPKSACPTAKARLDSARKPKARKRPRLSRHVRRVRRAAKPRSKILKSLSRLDDVVEPRVDRRDLRSLWNLSSKAVNSARP